MSVEGDDRNGSGENTPLLSSVNERHGGSGGNGEGNNNEAESREEDLHVNRDFQLISVPQEAPIFSLKKLWKFTGPGFLMSIAFLDPGNIEGDLQVGAAAQYKLLWVLLWSTIVGLILQLLAAKLGVVTGQHLAQVCRDKFPFFPRILLWLCVELAIIGSDIQEVIGSALAINILSQGTIPMWGGCLITGADTFTFLFLERYGLRYLEAFFGGLIGVMCAMFGYMYISARPSQLDVLKGSVIPYCHNCSSNAMEQGLGLVGAIIQPHNLYLHSGLVLSRFINRSNRIEIKEGIKYNSIESTVALSVSFFINMFVICVFGAGIYAYHYPPDTPDDVRDSCTADSINLISAVDCLYYRYGKGKWVKYVWALGLLAAGQSSTMTGTYAGQFVMDGFLNINWAKWKRVLLTRSIAIVPCVIIAILARNSLDYLNDYINMEQFVLLPFSILPLLHATSDKEIMKEFVNSRCWGTVVWILGTAVMLVNVYFIIDRVAIPGHWWRHLAASIGLFLYILIIMYFALYPVIKKMWEYYKTNHRRAVSINNGDVRS